MHSNEAWSNKRIKNLLLQSPIPYLESKTVTLKNYSLRKTTRICQTYLWTNLGHFQTSNLFLKNPAFQDIIFRIPLYNGFRLQFRIGWYPTLKQDLEYSPFNSVFSHVPSSQYLTLVKLCLTLVLNGYFHFGATSVSSIGLLNVACPVLGDGNMKINKATTDLVKETDLWADDYNQGRYSKYFTTNETQPPDQLEQT